MGPFYPRELPPPVGGIGGGLRRLWSLVIISLHHVMCSKCPLQRETKARRRWRHSPACSIQSLILPGTLSTVRYLLILQASSQALCVAISLWKFFLKNIVNLVLMQMFVVCNKHYLETVTINWKRLILVGAL